MDLKFTDGDPWQGVAVEQNGELWAAIGPVNTVGLVVYKIRGGNLSGTWMNATGDASKFGSENLSGAATIEGRYNIVAASSTGADCAVVRFKIDPRNANLMGDYYTVSQAHGDYMLTKDAE